MMKYGNLLNKRFFRENPAKQISAQQIAQFNIKILDTDVLQMVDDIVSKEISDERRKAFAGEADRIARIKTADEAIRFMRKDHDQLNSSTLLKKLSEFENEVAPIVIKMMLTTGNTAFIETATRFLSKCSGNYSNQIMENFDNMRSLYAQSMMFIVLGFRADEDVIPWMYDKYFEFKKKDIGDETYSEGALLALYELDDRFFAK